MRATVAGPPAAGTIRVIELTDSLGIIPNPPSLLVMIVVFSAFSGGLKSGLATHVIACFYSASTTRSRIAVLYAEDNLLRVIGFALTTRSWW